MVQLVLDAKLLDSLLLNRPQLGFLSYQVHFITNEHDHNALLGMLVD